MKKLLFWLGIVICLSINSIVFAQIVPDKREVKLDIKPGEVSVGSIIVENMSDIGVAVKAYFEDFVYASPYNGLKEILPLGSTPRSCGEWIKVSPEDFDIPARSKQEVLYSIKVPQEARGGYYGVLFFEKGAIGPSDGKGIGIILRTGCSFFLETPDKEKNAKIENISIAKDAIEGQLLNSGNVVLISTGTFHIMDKESMVLGRGDVGKFYLPPGEKTRFAVSLANEIPPGDYALFINFDLEEGMVLLKEIDFSKDIKGNLEVVEIKD